MNNVEVISGRSIESIRNDFPILSQSLPPIYLDNAASTHKPHSVIQALQEFYSSGYANVHRALYNLGEIATESYEKSRTEIQRFIGARSSSEVIFTRGTTEGINLVASAWTKDNLTTGDEILLTEMEHHSNLVPWQIAASERGVPPRPSIRQQFVRAILFMLSFDTLQPLQRNSSKNHYSFETIHWKNFL